MTVNELTMKQSATDPRAEHALLRFLGGQGIDLAVLQPTEGGDASTNLMKQLCAQVSDPLLLTLLALMLRRSNHVAASPEEESGLRAAVMEIAFGRADVQGTDPLGRVSLLLGACPLCCGLDEACL